VLPAETGLVERTVSFTKGCYVGQEPVARLHYRGHPNRHLRRLLSLEGALPSVPAEIALGDRVVGRLTSVVQPPGDGPAVGLGYVRREVEEGAIVDVRQPVGEPSRARVTAQYPASMAARRP
jgi:tRNA-modifying protein YgfZ